jgi:meiotic recombination protein SPO11
MLDFNSSSGTSSVPIVGFVDADPYGLDILSVYKFGSASMQHEANSLVADRVDWLGLSIRDLEEFGLRRLVRDIRI